MLNLTVRAINGPASGGASVNEPRPRTTATGPQFSGDLSLVVTQLNNERLLVVTAHEVHVCMDPLHSLL